MKLQEKKNLFKSQEISGDLNSLIFWIKVEKREFEEWLFSDNLFFQIKKIINYFPVKDLKTFFWISLNTRSFKFYWDFSRNYSLSISFISLGKNLNEEFSSIFWAYNYRKLHRYWRFFLKSQIPLLVSPLEFFLFLDSPKVTFRTDFWSFISEDLNFVKEKNSKNSLLIF